MKSIATPVALLATLACCPAATLYQNDFSTDLGGMASYDNTVDAPATGRTASISVTGGGLVVTTANNGLGSAYAPSIDPTAYSSITVSGVVTSVSGALSGNGLFVGFADINDSSYINGTADLGLRLARRGTNMVVDVVNVGNTSFENVATVSWPGPGPFTSTAPAEYASFQDGFTFSITINADDTYSYSILGSDLGAGSLGGGGTIAGVYASFGTSMFPVLSSQSSDGGGSSDPDSTTVFDSITVSATPVPEPSIALLGGLGLLGLLRRRR